jgi:hypothetical protein
LRAQAQRELALARTEAEQGRTQAEQARAEAAQALIEQDRARKEAQIACNEVLQVRAELERATAEVEKTRIEAANARAQAEQTRAEVDRVRDEAHQLRADVQRADGRLAAAKDASNRLREAIGTLDQAVNLSEVLERLVEAAGREADRVALLLIKGERMTAWRFSGFPVAVSTPRAIELRTADAGLIGRAAHSGAMAAVEANGDSTAELPPFAADAGHRTAAAVPVRVGGSVVAVLYADAPAADDPSSESRWPAILEVLVRHAGSVLEAITVRQAAGLPLPAAAVRGSQPASPSPA